MLFDNIDVNICSELTPDIEARIVGSELLKELFVDTEQPTGHGGTVSRGLQ